MLGGKYVIMNKEKELIEIVNFAIEKCPYYNSTLKPISSAKEFEKLPIIDGSILKENTFPNGNGMFSGELESAFIFSTGGTTGTPKYTFRDFKDFKDNYVYFDSLDIKPTDIVANLFAPGIWGTFTSHNIGLTQTGCVIIPMGAKDISEEKAEFSINTMKKLRVNTIVGTPSIIIVLIDRLKKYSVNLEIEKIYTVGELMYDSTYKYIKSFFKNANIKSMYGSVDCAGIGIQCKTCIKTQYHVLDYVYVEIIDDNGNVLPNGQEGNIVVTVLKKRLVPIIRYRLGDRGVILKDKCKCGKEILHVIGRNDNKFIIGCTMLSLKTIESNFSEITDRFQIQIEKVDSKDKITIIAESEENTIEIKEKLKEKLFISEPELQDDIKLGRCFEPQIIITKPYSLPVNEHSGKIKKIVDNRK